MLHTMIGRGNRMGDVYRLELLGQVQITRAGEPVCGFRSRKALALLAYLIRQKQAVARPRLADLFWPDKPEALGRRNLSWVLSRISTRLPDCLRADRHSIQYQPNPALWVDVLAFEALVRQNDPAALTEAAALYRGAFMEDLYLEGCPDFETWLVSEQETWRRQVIQVLDRLVAHHGQHRAYGQAQQFATRLLALEPWREETHRHLMRLLALSGQRSAALAQYEACRQVLAEELGVEPGTETIALHEQIRAGKFDQETGELAGITVSPVHPSAPRHNLPAQTTPFVGRAAELARLARWLDDSAIRLLTILGLGGMGKTRLALEAATGQVARYRDGVFFVSLAPLRGTENMIFAIAEAVGYPLQADQRSPRQQLFDYFRQKQILLVLDNFEHLLAPSLSSPPGEAEGGAELVAELLKVAPKVRLLVTSRERLKLSGETVFSLGGFAVPADERAAGESDAVQLFCQGAERVRPDFRLDEETLAFVVQICRQVGGMPLAILLAAAWLEVLSPAEIAAEIGRSLDFLTADLHDLPQRQHSLRAVFDYSWGMLDEAERDVFMKLSVFRGGCMREALQAVTGASLQTLTVLINKSFLQREATGRYQVHELLRQYAEEILIASGQAETTCEAHGLYYTHFLHHHEAALKGKGQRASLNEIEADGENVRAAWTWAVMWRQVELIEQSVDGLGLFYNYRGRYHEGEATYRRAVERLGTIASGEGRGVLARILTWQGLFSRKLGDTRLASQLQEQALALLEGAALAGQDTRSARAFLMLEMGLLGYDTGTREAKHCVEQSLALYRMLEDQWGMAQVLFSLGQAFRASGLHAEEKELKAESLRLRRTLGDQRGIADALESLGYTAVLQGQAEQGESWLRQGLAIRQEIGDQAGLMRSLSTLGMSFIYLGKFDEAYVWAEERVRISDELGNRRQLAIAIPTLGLANLHLGRYEQAHAQGQRSLTLCQEVDNRWGTGKSLALLGQVALAEGAYARAYQALQESIAIYQKMEEWYLQPNALISLGHAAQGLGDIAQGQQCLVEVLQRALENRVFARLVDALPLAALLLVDQGEQERAVECYALASRHLYVANSCWFEAVAGRHIGVVAATLPPEIVAAAQERGRARDLWATVAELLAELEDSV